MKSHELSVEEELMVASLKEKSGGVFIWLRYAYDTLRINLSHFDKPLTKDMVCSLTIIICIICML